MNRIYIHTIMILLAVAVIGCSGSGGPVEPAKYVEPACQAGSHQLWGIWQFKAEPDAGTLDVIPIRSADIHLNALRFLEPPVKLYLNVANVKYTGNILDCDVLLRHPFLGLVQFTGFDVCGIFITNGSISGFSDAALRMAGEGDIYLMNPDGLTRWWNPTEFPHEDNMFSYRDGLLGTPYDVAGYNCTLNAYKFFCDDIAAPDAPLSSVAPTSRCHFSAGSENIRHYKIKFVPGPFVFNYAVDASWKLPEGTPPWHVPEDFPPTANRVEAWNVKVAEVDNTLWNDGAGNGGGLKLRIDVWDHYDTVLNSVIVESPGNFAAVSSATPIGSGAGYSTYEVEIIDATPAPDSINLLLTIQSPAAGYQNLLPGIPVCAYFTHTSPVGDTPPGPEECGEGIFNSYQQTPFLDQETYQMKYEVGWLVSGPYTGQMLVSSAPGTISRYDMDAIAPHSGTIFAQLPPGTYTPNPGLLYHIEVDPTGNRVLVVPDISGGGNNSIFIYDHLGALMNPDEPLSVGDVDRHILAMDVNDKGDIWMLTATGAFSNAVGNKLERWSPVDGPPWYVHVTDADLDVGEYMGVWSDYYKDYVVGNDIVDMVISYKVQRIFIFQQAHIGEHNGRLYVFDLNFSGPPTYREDLYNGSLFSSPTWRGFNDKLRNAYGGIWCDHNEADMDNCRVLLYGRRHPDIMTMLIKLDAEDCSILGEIVLDGPKSPYTMGVNEDADETKWHLVFVNYPQTECYMSPAVLDW